MVKNGDAPRDVIPGGLADVSPYVFLLDCWKSAQNSMKNLNFAKISHAAVISVTFWRFFARIAVRCTRLQWFLKFSVWFHP